MNTRSTRLSPIVAILAACALAVLTPTMRADTPDAYLDYVESTGTQMVDTECLVGSNYTIVAEYAYPDPIVGKNNYLFGVYKQGMTAGFFYSNSGSYPLRFQKANGTSGATTTEAGLNATPNARQTVTMRIGAGTSSIVSETGETLYSGILGGTIRQDATAPLALFTVNISGSPSSSYTSAAKIYHLRIYNGDGAIVCNLLPCRKDNRAALYDKVADKILFATGGDLVAGSELPRPVEFVKWVQSDGASGDRRLYIDTGVPGKAGIGMTAELLWPAKPSAASNTVCGAMADSTHHFTLYTSAGTHQIGYANYSAFQVNTGTSVVYPDKRYRVTSSLTKSAQNLQVEDLDGTGYNGSRFFNDANSIDAARTLYLFARNDAGTPNQFSRVRLYSLMLTNEVGVVRDFIPCVADNGKAGLYDRISERVFFPKAAVPGATAEFSLATEVGAVTNRPAATKLPLTGPEWIAANGTNDYVNLGIVARDGVRMVAEVEWNDILAATFCGAATNSSTALFTTYRATTNFHRIGYYNGYKTLGGGNCMPVAGVRYRVETSLDDGNQTIAVKKLENGVWVPVGKGSDTFNLSFPAGFADFGIPLYLFACNLNGRPDEFAPVRLYFVKLWQDGSLVRDIRPAYYPDDNAPALFDRLNWVWYFNDGGYRFEAGGATKPFVGRGSLIFVE